MKKMIALLMVILICAGLLVGCGSGDTSSGQEKVDLSKMTAEDIAEQLQSHGLPIDNIIVYNEETDVNQLLGRPNQYTSKVNFADQRIVNQSDIKNNPVGGSIEVFSNSADAKARKNYLHTIQGTTGFLSQYLYQYDNVLLRLDHELSKEAAEEYNTAVKTLYEGKSLGNNSTSSTITSAPIDYSALQPSQQVYDLHNSYGDSLIGNYAFEVTNTFDQAIMIDGYTVDFLNADGAILESDDGVNLVPRIIQPGEKAYCGNIFSIDTTGNAEDVKTMEVKLKGVKPTKKKLEMLEFSNLNLLETKHGGLKITGKATNNTSKDISLGSATVALLGDNNKLIATTYVSIDKLSKGESQSFETEFDNTNKADVKKTVAVGYDFDQTLF